MSFWVEDLAGMFDDFSVSAVFTPASTGIPRNIQVLFDDAFKALDVATMEFATSQPQAISKSADVTGILQGDALQVAGVVYTVTDIQPDGTGITLILLRR